MNDEGTLRADEHHPAADSAKEWFLRWVRKNGADEVLMLQESFASTGLSGNRTAQLCSETLRRLLNGEPVSDRYLLGLVWTIRAMEDSNAYEA